MDVLDWLCASVLFILLPAPRSTPSPQKSSILSLTPSSAHPIQCPARAKFTVFRSLGLLGCFNNAMAHLSGLLPEFFPLFPKKRSPAPLFSGTPPTRVKTQNHHLLQDIFRRYYLYIATPPLPPRLCRFSFSLAFLPSCMRSPQGPPVYLNRSFFSPDLNPPHRLIHNFSLPVASFPPFPKETFSNER